MEIKEEKKQAIKGGEFIVGKFDNTLPKFFSQKRPMASLINFDADLYTSTLCALNYSNKVIDEKSILIFDEFLMNDNWEKDTDKTKLKDAIKDLNKNHFNLIKTWIDENPNFKEDDKKQDYFSNLLRTCGTNIDDVSDKVAKKICNLTHIKEQLKDLDENLIE